MIVTIARRLLFILALCGVLAAPAASARSSIDACTGLAPDGEGAIPLAQRLAPDDLPRPPPGSIPSVLSAILEYADGLVGAEDVRETWGWLSSGRTFQDVVTDALGCGSALAIEGIQSAEDGFDAAVALVTRGEMGEEGLVCFVYGDLAPASAPEVCTSRGPDLSLSWLSP